MESNIVDCDFLRTSSAHLAELLEKLGNGTLRHLDIAFNILYQSLRVDWGRFLELTDAEASLPDSLLSPGRLW